MPPPKPGKRYITAEVPADLALRFQKDCHEQDRSVSGGLRRLVREYLDGPVDGDGAAVNDAARETSKTAPAEGDLVSQAY